MARSSNDTSSWPMTITTAAHPHHVLVHLLFFRNSCDVCGGALAGKLGYRCEACDFDIHCQCLPEHRIMPQGRAPRPYPYSHYPPPSRPSSHAVPAPPPPPACNHQHGPPRPFRPQFNLSLSGNFDVPQHHQQQIPPSPQRPQYYTAQPPPQSYSQPQQSYPAPQPPQSYSQLQQSYPAPQPQQSYDNGYYADGPVGYNHLQQQQDYYPTTNNYGEYMDNYSTAMEFGDAYADDYYDSRDYRDEPDPPGSYSHLQQQQDDYQTTNNNYGDYVDNYSGDAYADDYDSRDYGDADYY